MAKRQASGAPASVNRQRPVPLGIPRTVREHQISVLTSLPAGKMVPIAAMPLLREDGLKAAMRIQVEMMETKELLANPVDLRITAYVVPWLAFQRFGGSRDIFDRSFKGVEHLESSGYVVPFFETHDPGTHGYNQIYKYLGLHTKSGTNVNSGYLEAYNAIWNFRAKNRSPDITQRTRWEVTLAPAFWGHSRFQHVIPDFDQAVIDGEVPLNVVEASIPVRSHDAVDGSAQTGPTLAKVSHYLSTDSTLATPLTLQRVASSTDARFATAAGGTNENVRLRLKLDELYAELQENGITVSLSNIELARKAQTFARLREQFAGYDDEWIIDMLMDGLHIPDQYLKQPILVAERLVRFGQAKRYATDSGNLAESAVSGGAGTDITLRVPRLETGGVVMVLAEAVPVQLFERQQDPYLWCNGVEDLPAYLRDELDPEKVDVVTNGEIDVRHATPADTFGYAPLNWKWTAMGPKVGGKFLRPTTDTTTDDVRSRLWAVEAANPVLSEDFYIVSEMHTKPFLDTESDPFEATVTGLARIEGNTVFGPALVEASDNYDEVMEEAPMDRIDKEA